MNLILKLDLFSTATDSSVGIDAFVRCEQLAAVLNEGNTIVSDFFWLLFPRDFIKSQLNGVPCSDVVVAEPLPQVDTVTFANR